MDKTIDKDNEVHIKKEKIFDTDNHLSVVVEDTKTKNKYISQECCTCINILLTNDGDIATSFLGVHNDEIIKILERAQKLYFKKIKKEFRAKDKQVKASSKKYSTIRVKKSSPNVTFDKDNNDYDAVEPVSASDLIGHNKKLKKKDDK